MKWFVYLAILGIIEVALIGKLHEFFGLYNLIGLYILTTIIGAIFLLIKLRAFRKSLKYMKNLDGASLKKFKDVSYVPSAEEIEKMRPLLFFVVYVIAAIHIAIPGIVSDIIGMIIIMPFISNYYIGCKIKKAVQKAKE